MATQRYISTSFWDDAWVQSIDPSEKLLYLYLMTNPLTNIAGIYKITDKRIHDDTGFNVEMIVRLIERFQKAGKAHRAGEYIIIPSWPKHQKWREKPTIDAGIRKILSELPMSIRNKALRVGYLYPMDTIPIPYGYQPSYLDSDIDKDAPQDSFFEDAHDDYSDEEKAEPKDIPIPEPEVTRPRTVYNPNEPSKAFEQVRVTWNTKPGLPPFHRLFMNLFNEEREIFMRMLIHGTDKLIEAIENYNAIIDDPGRYGFDMKYAFKTLPNFLKSVEKYFEKPREAKGPPGFIPDDDNTKYDALMRSQG